MNRLKRALSNYSHAWRALRSQNFRLFFVGQGISVIGTWMTRMASSWLVYRLTNSALLLGIVGFSSQIVPFIFQPFAGVWVERGERRKIMIWTQIAACLQSLALAVLTLMHVITIWEIIALCALQGFINAFDTPARQSFLVEMVDDPRDLSNAIALNSMLMNGGRLIGPAIAGVVIAAVGEGWCFAIDGASYIAVIASLFMMSLRAREMVKTRGSMLEQMREGWDYVRSFLPVRTTLTLFSITSLMGYPYTVLLPVFAKQVLHGDAHTLGFLTGASGLGAVTSAISLALRKSILGLTRRIQFAAALLGVSLIGLGFSHSEWLSMFFMFVSGFGLMQVAAGSNTVIQSLAPGNMRARVMSYYAMAFFGSAPIGSLIAGVMADHIGAPHTVIVTGFVCAIGAVWYTFALPEMRKAMRPVYEDLGILPNDPKENEYAKT